MMVRVAHHRWGCPHALDSTSWHMGAQHAVHALFEAPRCASPRRHFVSGLFARPEVTLEDLERRLVQILEGDDSVRSDLCTAPSLVDSKATTSCSTCT